MTRRREPYVPKEIRHREVHGMTEFAGGQAQTSIGPQWRCMACAREYQLKYNKEVRDGVRVPKRRRDTVPPSIRSCPICFLAVPATGICDNH